MHAGRDANEYDPIPLTKEWLINFGFESVNFDHGFMLNGFCVMLSEVRVTINYRFLLSSHYWDKGLMVHQLQNLYFALMGWELELTHNVVLQTKS